MQQTRLPGSGAQAGAEPSQGSAPLLDAPAGAAADPAAAAAASDLQLLDAIAGADRAALGCLYDRHAVAVRLGVSVDVVKGQLGRALGQLRAQVGSSAGESS